MNQHLLILNQDPQELVVMDMLWKYLYTITPSDIIKFDSIDYIPVPENWGSGDTADVKNNAVDGKIETALIVNAGGGYQPISTTF
jgi:hypothetical protein